MTRLSLRLLTVIAIVLHSLFTYAQSPGCFSAAPVNYPADIPATPLNNTQQETLLTLFDNLNGDWQGFTEGFFCSSSKNKSLSTTDNYDIRVESQLQREKRNSHIARFDFNATLESGNRAGNDTLTGFTHEALMNEKIQYNIRDGILYFGLRQTNPVIIKDLRNNAVTLVESFAQRLNSGATTPRLIIRKITLLNARTIRIDNFYYTRNQLFSSSRWNLRR